MRIISFQALEKNRTREQEKKYFSLERMFLCVSDYQCSTRSRRTTNVILCMACNTSNDGSCVGCTSPSARSALGIFCTGRAFHQSEAVCVQSGGACAWRPCCTHHTCVDVALWSFDYDKKKETERKRKICQTWDYPKTLFHEAIIISWFMNTTNRL